MKLKEFNKINSQQIRFDKPSIRVNSNSGSIHFTKLAIELLKLDDFKYMKIMQDEDTGDWYLAPTNMPDGFDIHVEKKRSLIYNSQVAKAINKGISDNSAAFLISQNPVIHGGYSLYLIIKSSAPCQNTKKIEYER